MRRIVPILVLCSLIMMSCEKDYFYDTDCDYKRGGNIGGWEEGDSTDIKNEKDTTTGGFYIEVNEWGDTIQRNIIL